MPFRVCVTLVLASFSCAIAQNPCPVASKPAAPLVADGPSQGNSEIASPAKEGLLWGKVVDPVDAPIPAFMLIHSDRNDNKINTQIRVESDGTFQLKLTPGLYDLFIAYTAFRPMANIVEIKAGKKTHLKLTMQIDQKHLESVLVE